MKKLSLDLDQLAVESFDTSGPERSRGTVRGFDITASTCYEENCGCITDGGTCNTDCGQNTCDNTCNQASCAGDSCVNLCPTGGAHTCIQPSCFYSCPGTCMPGDTCFC
jgi:hypothetical protein